jgi:putative tricarboxylic transport membrane protein
MAVAALLGLLGAILFAQTMFSPDSQEPNSAVLPAGDSKAAWHLLPGFALFLAYVTLMPWIGFTVGSVLFVFCFALWMGRYGILASGALAIGIPALLWSIFSYLLAVHLPPGSWGL